MAEKTASGKAAWDKEKTHELFRRYKEHGDMDAREKLVMSHLNLVRFLANKFKNRGEPLDDLMQVGYSFRVLTYFNIKNENTTSHQ